jgi:hypothetical protein
MEFYVEERRPPLWSSGQSSWLQNCPLSLLSTTEELLGRKSSCCDQENLDYRRTDPSPCPRGTIYPQKSSQLIPFLTLVATWYDQTESRLIIVYTELLKQLVATDNCYILTKLHTRKMTVTAAHRYSLVAAWYRLLTADVPLPPGFQTVPHLSYLLVASHNCNSNHIMKT